MTKDPYPSLLGSSPKEPKAAQKVAMAVQLSQKASPTLNLGKVFARGTGYLGTGQGYNRLDQSTLIEGALKDKKVISIQVGYNSTVALTSEGRIYIWGKHRYLDKLPEEGSDKRFGHIFSPFLLEEELVGKKAIAIRTGSWHHLALTDDGEIYGWGSIIDGHYTKKEFNNTRVRRINGPWKNKKVTDIVASYENSLVITLDGDVYGWGDNRDHDLGEKKAFISYPTLLKK